MQSTISFAAAFALSAAASFASAQDWPNWRGPNYNGSVKPAQLAKDLPVEFSPASGVAWKAELPGPAASTPIVWQDRVFLTSTDLDRDMLVARCLDRKSGKTLWSKDISKGLQKDSRSYFAAPSPSTDGKHVYFFFSNGELWAFDLEGNKQWSRNIQKDYGTFAFLWTFSSSPLLYDGRLYLQVLQRDTAVDGRGFADRENLSYLLALDPGTGKELFKHIRPSPAKWESREAFSTPIPFEHNGRREVLVVGGDVITGHDPDTGDELWRWGTWNPQQITHWRLVPTPVASDGVILACAPKKDPIYAVKAGGKGRLSDDALAWVSTDDTDVSSDVPTPAFYDGDFFVLSDVRKSLSRVEPKSGKVKWTVRTPGRDKYEASPLVADGKVYALNFAGAVAVFDTENGKLLSENEMGNQERHPVRSSVIAAHGQIFVRTNNALYCID